MEFIAGLLTGAVTVALAAVSWRRLRPAAARLRYLVGTALLAGLAIAAGVMYLTGSGGYSHGGDADSVPVSAPQDPAAAGATPVSRTNAAASAPSAPLVVPSPSAPSPSAPSPPASPAGELERRVTSHPDDASAWLALAEERLSQTDYPGARAAYARVVELQGMSAQPWADYADVLSALAGGSLSGEADAAIDTALSLDAWNPKAMRLKATQEHEQHNDAEALVWWRRLRAVLPPDSPDVPIVNAKIAEAEVLTHGAPPSPPPQKGK